MIVDERNAFHPPQGILVVKHLLKNVASMPLATSPADTRLPMKEQGIKFWQLNEEDIKRLPKQTQILVYDTVSGLLKICHPGTQRCDRFLKYNKDLQKDIYIFLLHKEPQFL